MSSETGGWIIPMLMLFSPIVIGVWMDDRDYKQGQIDALTGNIKYELVQHPDGTKTWEEKK